MYVLAVADHIDPLLYDHYRPERFPKIDLILACGDLKQWYLSYLMSTFNAPLYYVRGNHDLSFEQTPPDGGEDIHGKLVNYQGIRILGFEGSQIYTRDAVQYTERQMHWQYLRTRPKLWYRGGVDIVITHAAPQGVHDLPNVAHAGFATYRKIIAKHSPKYFIHGHTHLNYGRGQKRVTKVGDTYVINAYGFYLLDYEKGPENHPYQTPR
ncbi:MAG: metallophosphoesterase [Firmicutes bacterium]|nr:metallophosphoesterase [Bacillota bacterium]